MMPLNEDTVEQASIAWLQSVGYGYLHGGTIAPGEAAAERDDYGQVLLVGRLRAALARINGHIPAAVRAGVIDDVIRRLQRSTSQALIENHHAFHRLLTEGVDVSYRVGDALTHHKVWLVDFANPDANDWLAVNQFTLTDVNLTHRAKTNRRPDLLLFINGLPLVIIELKNPTDENATLKGAYHQLQTYQQDIPTLFTYTELLVIADGVEARLGTTASGWEHFHAWRTVDGDALDPYPSPLETLIRGVLDKARLLDLIRHFIVFEQDGVHLKKKVAAYHQFYAVNKAVQSTLAASADGGNRQVGVMWHTQGSGKSLSMLFYAGKVIQHPAMGNPTLVMLTDRNDLDDQLFGTFAAGQALLRQTPMQANGRDHLRELLRVAGGGVVFTTIQKFMPDDGSNQYPTLSERRNIVFIADEAHRSQYGFEARLINGEIGYGFAKYVRDALPNASFIGFTGTPIETTDANTREVFGGYIDIYDIQRAVEDGATVPIYYEARLARLSLRDDQRPMLDPAFEEITEDVEDTTREKLKSKWSQLEAMVGTDERLAQVAADLVAHFTTRQTALEGKGMIVCMSRRIAVALYNQITRLRPDWHHQTDSEGAIKVIMTGSASDPAEYQPHTRNTPRRKAIAERFKDPHDALKLVIVRDMWLTGFDAPALHTLYVDKPMRGHGLMQAIARVNRVFGEKSGGLIVDYLGIADQLQQAIQNYTATNQAGRPTHDFSEALAIMQSAYDVVQSFFHGFDYLTPLLYGSSTERVSLIPKAMEHILQQPNGKKRFLDSSHRLAKAYALVISSEAAQAIRESVAFFQAIRAAFVRYTSNNGRTTEDMDAAVRQLVSGAIASEGVVDLFSAAGLRAPNVSILSEEFLEDVRALPQRNLALELLQRLIKDEIRSRGRRNVVQARAFSDLLEQALRRYQNRTIDAQEVVAELIDIAREVRDSIQRGNQLNLSEDEMAFYDALANNTSARDVMGDRQLAVIATDLLKSVQANVTIDWTVKQAARAKIRVLVKRILRKYGYPPDLEEAATQLVLEQAELIAADWVG
ncbi:MAG: type I restriction endonuclease subunit R [Phototrophicaceae bacterium]